MDIQKLKKKKERAKAEGNLDNEYFTCKQLAEIYFSSEKYNLALEEYKEMEKISGRLGNKMDVGRANRMIGEVYCEKGDFDKAVSHQTRHLVISREEENRVEEQRALATLGRTYFLKAESFADVNSVERFEALHQAKAFYKESLAVCNKLSDNDIGQRQRLEMIGRLFLNIGLALDSQNQYESAIDYMQKAVSICKKLDLWEDLYRTYLALGGAYHRHHDNDQSIKIYDLAIDVAERLNNKTTLICDALLLKTEVLLDLPDMRGARQVLLKAYKLKPSSSLLLAEIEKKLRIVAAMCECEDKLANISSECDDIDRKKLYEEMGDAASELNNFKLALIYYHLMLECVEKCGNEKKALIDAYISLAQTYKDDQQYMKSLEFFKKELALEDSNSPEACKTLLNIAEVYQIIGLKQEMFDIYNEAKRIALNSNDTRLKKLVLGSLHSALVGEMRHSEAESVQMELNALSADLIDDSSDEEEDVVTREFGLHIDLDQLTDDDCGESGKEAGDGRRQEGRARPKRSRAPNIEKKNEKGETPLHVASIQGNVSHVLKLIEQGHRVDVHDNSGWTPLHEACNHGHIEVVRVLLEHGASVNDRGGPHCDGVTPLLDAASNGNLDIINVLLDHGASPLMRTNKGESVIDCLSGWRRRRYEEVGVDISGTTLAQYKTVYKKLGHMLEKVGQKQKGSDSEDLPKEEISPGKDNISPVKRFSENRKKLCFSSAHTSEKKSSENRRNAVSAATHYENAIKALRFRNNQPEIERDSTRCEKVEDGLIAENQVGVEDWLEDDMLASRPNKKRRTCDSYFNGTNSHPEPSTSRRISLEERSPSHANDFEERNISSSSFTDSTDTKQCAAGSQPTPETSRSSPLTENTSKSQEKTSPNSLLPKSTYSFIKVCIESKAVIVPIPAEGYHNLTVAWLASEAALRYKSLEGTEPVLQLELDGGLLVGSDPLSIITPSSTTVVQGRVQSWRLASLSKLYRESCQALKQDVNEEVDRYAEECEQSGRVSLEDCYLHWSSLEPFLRAAARYRALTSLCLSSNPLPSSTILEVAECLSKLAHIKELDISNTNLSEKELQTIGKIVKQNNGFQRVETLKIGYNPVKEWGDGVQSMVECAPSLTHLSAPALDLSPRAISVLRLSLDCLDVSYNELNKEGLEAVLSNIDWKRLKTMNLAACGVGVVRLLADLLQHHKPPNLVHLDFSYMPYSETDLSEFIKSTAYCKNLTKISLGSKKEYTGNDLVESFSSLSSNAVSHAPCPLYI